jgi:hypothetical protein
VTIWEPRLLYVFVFLFEDGTAIPSCNFSIRVTFVTFAVTRLTVAVAASCQNFTGLEKSPAFAHLPLIFLFCRRIRNRIRPDTHDPIDRTTKPYDHLKTLFPSQENAENIPIQPLLLSNDPRQW